MTPPPGNLSASSVNLSAIALRSNKSPANGSMSKPWTRDTANSRLSSPDTVCYLHAFATDRTVVAVALLDADLLMEKL